MPAISKWAERARFALECLSYLAVVLGIGFFFIQQNAAQRAQRVEIAMRFVALATEPAYVETREQLVAPFRQYDMSTVSPAAAPRILSAVSSQHIERMKDFYSSILICREKLCDEGTIDQFFREDIYHFYCYYRARLGQIGRQLDRPDYAGDLRVYAGNCTPRQRQR